MPARIKYVASRIIQWQAQAECDSFLYLGNALLHLRWGEQVQSAELIVRPKIAPGGPLRAVLPAFGSGHLPLLLFKFRFGWRRVRQGKSDAAHRLPVFPSACPRLQCGPSPSNSNNLHGAALFLPAVPPAEPRCRLCAVRLQPRGCVLSPAAPVRQKAHRESTVAVRRSRPARLQGSVAARPTAATPVRRVFAAVPGTT